LSFVKVWEGRRMTRTSSAAFYIVIVSAMVAAIGCTKPMFYDNVFGQYTLSDAHKQYAELFQMEPSEYERFLTFENGWWKADVKKMRQMGISVTDLCERYCRTESISVPFPALIDYELLYGAGM
jgi:hypothetical protein